MTTSDEFQFGPTAQARPRSSVLESCANILSTFKIGVVRFMSHWKILVAGQMLSFLLAAAGAASTSMHIDCNLSAPAAQTAVVYFLMSLHIRGIGRVTGAESSTGAGLGSWITGSSLGGERAASPSEPASESPSPPASVSTYKNMNNQSSGRGLSIVKVKSLLDLLKKATKLDGKDNNTSELPSALSCHQAAKPKEYNDSAIDIRPHLRPAPILLCNRIPISVPIWIYILFAFIHVQANYFTYLAFRYTAMTSVSLLDNLNILSAMLCSKVLLKRKYRTSHVLGAFICIVGVGLNLMSDYEKSEENPDQMDDINDQTEVEEYPHRLVGDLFAILGGLLVGFTDVLIEMLVKDFVGPNEYIGMVGFFGFFLSVVQVGIFERRDVAKFFTGADVDMDVADEYVEYDDPYDAPRTCAKSKGLLLLLTYILAIYLFNVGISRFLTVSESAFLTLSLLTGDLWAVTFTVVAEKVAPSSLFYIAFIIIIIGVIIYETAPSPLEGTKFNIEEKPIEQAEYNENDSNKTSADDRTSWKVDYDKGNNTLQEDEKNASSIELT